MDPVNPVKLTSITSGKSKIGENSDASGASENSEPSYNGESMLWFYRSRTILFQKSYE